MESHPHQYTSHSHIATSTPIHQSLHSYGATSTPIHQSLHSNIATSTPIHQSLHSHIATSTPIHQSLHTHIATPRPSSHNVPTGNSVGVVGYCIMLQITVTHPHTQSLPSESTASPVRINNMVVNKEVHQSRLTERMHKPQADMERAFYLPLPMQDIPLTPCTALTQVSSSGAKTDTNSLCLCVPAH